MNRNKQMFCRSFNPSIEEGIIEKPTVVGGKVLLDRVSVSDHYSQFDINAFSLQSIYDAGLIDQLKRFPAPSDNPLDILDRFADQAGDLNFKNSSVSAPDSSPVADPASAADPA